MTCIRRPSTRSASGARKVRRTAILLGLVALGFYVAFIVMSVSKA